MVESPNLVLGIYTRNAGNRYIVARVVSFKVSRRQYFEVRNTLSRTSNKSILQSTMPLGIDQKVQKSHVKSNHPQRNTYSLTPRCPVCTEYHHQLSRSPSLPLPASRP
jgi:hypothetical protein